jgi:hypothetical protein
MTLCIWNNWNKIRIIVFKNHFLHSFPASAHWLSEMLNIFLMFDILLVSSWDISYSQFGIQNQILASCRYWDTSNFPQRSSEAWNPGNLGAGRRDNNLQIKCHLPSKGPSHSWFDVKPMEIIQTHFLLKFVSPIRSIFSLSSNVTQIHRNNGLKNLTSISISIIVACIPFLDMQFFFHDGQDLRFL